MQPKDGAPKPKRRVKRLSKRKLAFTPLADKEWWANEFKAKNLSQRGVGATMFSHVGALSKVLGGTQRLPPEKWIELAKIVNRPLTLVLKKAGYEVKAPQTPVVGEVMWNARVSYGTKAINETVDAISEDPDGMQALVFRVDTGSLLGLDGMVLHYRASNTVDAETFGRQAIIQVEGEPTPVVGTIQRVAGRKLQVVLMTGEIIEGRRVLSASVVEGIVKP